MEPAAGVLSHVCVSPHPSWNETTRMFAELQAMGSALTLEELLTKETDLNSQVTDYAKPLWVTA